MGKITILDLAASVNRDPKLFENFYMRAIHAEVKSEYEYAEADEIMERYHQFERSGSKRCLLGVASGRYQFHTESEPGRINVFPKNKDDVEELRRLAEKESKEAEMKRLSGEQIMDIKTLNELKRQKDNLDSLTIQEKGSYGRR